MKTTGFLAIPFFAAGFPASSAETYTFTTLAGDNRYGNADGTGSAAFSANPRV